MTGCISEFAAKCGILLARDPRGLSLIGQTRTAWLLEVEHPSWRRNHLCMAPAATTKPSAGGMWLISHQLGKVWSIGRKTWVWCRMQAACWPSNWSSLCAWIHRVGCLWPWTISSRFQQTHLSRRPRPRPHKFANSGFCLTGSHKVECKSCPVFPSICEYPIRLNCKILLQSSWIEQVFRPCTQCYQNSLFLLILAWKLRWFLWS